MPGSAARPTRRSPGGGGGECATSSTGRTRSRRFRLDGAPASRASTTFPTIPRAGARRGRAGRGAAARARRQRRLEGAVHPLRPGALRARRNGPRARAVLAGGLRRRRLPAVRGRDERARDLRRAAATCSTRSRAPTSANSTVVCCSTSTSPTTRPARTTIAGPAPWRRRRTGSSSRSGRASERHPRGVANRSAGVSCSYDSEAWRLRPTDARGCWYARGF